MYLHENIHRQLREWWKSVNFYEGLLNLDRIFVSLIGKIYGVENVNQDLQFVDIFARKPRQFHCPKKCGAANLC